jgi:hypothetical protein
LATAHAAYYDIRNRATNNTQGGQVINTQLERFLKATWASPVFGDTFPSGHTPQRLAWAEQQLGAIAQTITQPLVTRLLSGIPEVGDKAMQHIVVSEILPKTLAFCPALTVGDLEDVPRLSAVTMAVALMYWGDQTMDRGDEATAEAIMLLGNDSPVALKKASAAAQARFSALSHIQEEIDQLARPEDAPFVVDCFYEQVLHNEVRMHELSLEYLASGKSSAFLAEYALELAEISTISAGFPSISSALYAIYRQHDPSLVLLAKIYGDPAMTNLLQVCNVVVRLWDELGDWEMDSGYDPSKGEFVINPFNQYDPAFVGRFCELAFITDTTQVASLQKAFAGFHDSKISRQEHGAYVLATLRDHIRHYMAATVTDLPADARKDYAQYLTLCKRVMEIGWVNQIGDINLSKG